MNLDRCKTCKFFIQHYAFIETGRGLSQIFCGHCTETVGGKLKKNCLLFAPKTDNKEEIFVDLYKRLLKSSEYWAEKLKEVNATIKEITGTNKKR